MKKFNKKGFTLIEMLVVIAIIAILVAIIVPTVSKATSKAKAATDAANLRSAMAEAEIYYLSQPDFELPASGTTTDLTGHVTAVTSKSNASDTLSVTIDSNGAITAKFGSNDVAYYAAKAE